MTEAAPEEAGSTCAPAGKRPRAGLLLLFVALIAVGAIIFAVVSTRQAAPKVGEPAPAFSLSSREGLKIDSQLLRNNIVVINFFASWCKPCQEEAADLEAVWKEYRPRGVFFLGVTYQDTAAKVNEFLQRNGITYLVAHDDGTLSKQFGVTGVPETYIIGRNGVLAFKQIGPITAAALRAELDKLVR